MSLRLVLLLTLAGWIAAAAAHAQPEPLPDQGNPWTPPGHPTWDPAMPPTSPLSMDRVAAVRFPKVWRLVLGGAGMWPIDWVPFGGSSWNRIPLSGGAWQVGVLFAVQQSRLRATLDAWERSLASGLSPEERRRRARRLARAQGAGIHLGRPRLLVGADLQWTFAQILPVHPLANSQQPASARTVDGIRLRAPVLLEHGHGSQGTVRWGVAVGAEYRAVPDIVGEAGSPYGNLYEADWVVVVSPEVAVNLLAFRTFQLALRAQVDLPVQSPLAFHAGPQLTWLPDASLQRFAIRQQKRHRRRAR
jgi:hypothetical protein